MRKNRRRNVTLDTSALVAYILSKKKDGLIVKVVRKSVSYDKLMLTDVICEECMRFAERGKVSREEISQKLKGLTEIIYLQPIPSNEELTKIFKIRDPDDLKILYSVKETGSEILVTYDKDFFDNVEGIETEVKHPDKYLYELKERIDEESPK